MYEHGGRYESERQSLRGMTSKHHHTYGQQLGWHALFLVAGECLAKHPVTDRSYSDENRWHDWLDREALRRKDGLWLADGIDRPPIETQVNLLEKGEKGLVLTASREKVLALLGVGATIAGRPLAVAGHWPSSDGVGVHVSSALVPPRNARKLALQLAKEDAFQAWVPLAEEYEDGSEFSRNDKPLYEPWCVLRSGEGGLDDTDPLAVRAVMWRQHFTRRVNTIGRLKPTDAFKRSWVNATGQVVASAEAWGRSSTNDEGESDCGHRLVCRAQFLQTVLAAEGKELVILIILRRYEKGYGSRDSQYWHTTGVLRVRRSLDFEFYLGSQNQLHVSKW